MKHRLKPMYNVGYRVKIAANTAVQLVGKGISASSSFIITILIARYFGVEAYGDFIKITTFVAFFYLLSDFGLNAVVVKELGHNLIKSDAFNKSENKSQILHSLFSARILLGIGLTLIAVMLTVFLPYSSATGEGFNRLAKLGIIIFAPTILFQALIRSTNAYFQYKLRYDKTTVALASGSIVALLLLAGIVFLKISSILSVVAALLVASGTTAFISHLLFKKTCHMDQIFSFNLTRILSLLKKSLPIGLTLALNIVFFRLDTFLLAIFRSTTEVGLYGLAYKFFEFALTLPTFFMNAVYPVMTKIETGNWELGTGKLKSMIKQSAVFLVATSIALTVMLWFLAPHIALIKSDFISSVILFRILILWLPLFFLSSLFMWIMIVKGRHWTLTLIYAVGLLLNAALNFIFIPSHGATAAAFTTGVTEFVILLFLLIKLQL